MSETTVWVIDSDVCEMCGGLLDWFGECPHCGWNPATGFFWDDSDRDEYEYNNDEDLSTPEELLFLKAYFEPKKESSPSEGEGGRTDV